MIAKIGGVPPGSRSGTRALLLGPDSAAPHMARLKDDPYAFAIRLPALARAVAALAP